MSDDIDNTTGRDAIAYAGETPWHSKGTPAKPEWTFDEWCQNAGVAYGVERVSAYAADLSGQPIIIPGCYFNRRTDTGAVLGTNTFTDRRNEIQPRAIMQFVHDIVALDDRLSLQVMGAVRKGAQVWAAAQFNGDLTVAGERHHAFIIARTGFDGSLASHFYTSMVRPVCKNTLAAGWDKSAMVTVRHSTRFDPTTVRKQLAVLAGQVERYKVIGDAMAQAEMAASEVSQLFKTLLDIPFEAKAEDISTRKMNCFRELSAAYSTSVKEGAPVNSTWAALQAVTRYVDHDRTARGDSDTSEDEKRFVSAQFGSGADMKAQAMGLLMPRIKDRVPVLA